MTSLERYSMYMKLGWDYTSAYFARPNSVEKLELEVTYPYTAQSMQKSERNLKDHLVESLAHAKTMHDLPELRVVMKFGECSYFDVGSNRGISGISSGC